MDDREEFNSKRRENVLALGKDDVAFQKSKEALIAADKHGYAYLWTWLGVPIIQMPADIVVTQEVIWREKPDVIIECGVARGGSVIFLASMLQLLGKGKVIGVDIDIRKHNLESIQSNPFAHRIELIEGSSVEAATVAKVKAAIPVGSKVMVILDSNHSYDHVYKELVAYAGFVTPGQYLVVADTLLGFLEDNETPTERSAIWKKGNEPLSALRDFLLSNPEFEADAEVNGKLILSSSPGGYLRKVVPADRSHG
jgi:cephalosporin hydroxylase